MDIRKEVGWGAQPLLYLDATNAFKEDFDKYMEEMEKKGFSNTYEFIGGKYAGKFPLEERKIRESWIRVFDIDEWNPRIIQANLWEIKKEWVKHILKPGESMPEKYKTDK